MKPGDGMVLTLLFAATTFAATPKLEIKLKKGTPLEQQELQQVERLAKTYDLTKYTLTRDILIEQGAIPHSSPVLTLNVRFLDDDDLALSQYLHEQAHWVIMLRHRNDLPYLYRDLKSKFPNIPTRPPEGDGEERSTYFHVVVTMLEWQAMEDLVGPERARRVIEWKKGDHYLAVYTTILDNREVVEKIMQHYAIHF